MFGKFILLGLLALAQCRPQDEQLASVATKCTGVTQYLIPNERDCSKFYICGVGRSVVREGVCAPGLEFSLELQQCADPAIAKCNCNTEPEEEVEPEPAPVPEPEEEREIIYLPNGCPEDQSVPQLLPHETMCDLYYQCERGEKVLRECAPGTSYAHSLQTCDHSANVGCISNGTTTQRTTTTTVAVEEDSREIIYLPNGCPEDFNVYLLLPHETICNKFYYCVHGEKVERECAPGTLYNPAIMVCDHPWNVDCQDVTTECICDNSEEDCDGSSTTTVKPNEKEDSGEKDESVEEEDSEENKESAEKEDSEENRESVEKEKSDENGDSNENAGSGEKEESNEKEESSEKENSGEKEDSAEKEESSEKENSSENNESAEKEESDENKESGENGGSSCENGEGGDPNECNCGSDESQEVEDLRCKEDCHVPHWTHESDCDKFWRCVGGEKVLGVCSEGLHFNEKTQTCDFICNAGCKRREVQSTAHRDGLKLFLPWDKVNDLFKDSSVSVKKFIKKRN